MKKQIADLTSNILNPILLSLALLIFLSFESTVSTSDAIKWSLISIAVSILPVFLVIVYLVRKERLENIFVNARQQRNKIYLLASFCTAVGCIILFYMEAPSLLVAVFTAGLSATLVFTCINLFWKISLHTAFVAASIAILTILYGGTVAVAAVLLPVIAWARIELEHHSIAQVIAGALLASIIAVVVLHLFGLIPC